MTLYLFQQQKENIMSKYKLEVIKNNFLESTKVLIIETSVIEGKSFSDILYEFNNINQSNSKINFLKSLEKI
jgi:hypothetical protein